MSSDYDLSIEDLVDLLHSVDHEKVVKSKDAVISDEALAALLDRTLTSDKMNSDPGFKEKEKEDDSLKSANSIVHLGLFKVIAERDSTGKLIGEQNSEQNSELPMEQDNKRETSQQNTDQRSIEQSNISLKAPGNIPNVDACSLALEPEIHRAPANDCHFENTSTCDTSSSSPEPVSIDSLRSSSSTSISSSVSSTLLGSDDNVQSMDAAGSAIVSCSSAPGLSARSQGQGVVVTDTVVNVCADAGEMGGGEVLEADRVISATVGSVITS